MKIAPLKMALATVALAVTGIAAQAADLPARSHIGDERPPGQEESAGQAGNAQQEPLFFESFRLFHG